MSAPSAMLRRAAPAAGVTLLAACSWWGGPAVGAAAVPARWVSPTASCIQQAADFASQQTGRKVSLTDAAFTRSDRLLLEPALHRGADGRPLDGRSLGRPEAFRLVLDGGRCVMLSEDVPPGKRPPLAVLTACECVAAAGAR